MIVLILTEAVGDFKILSFKENKDTHCDHLFVTSWTLVRGQWNFEGTLCLLLQGRSMFLPIVGTQLLYYKSHNLVSHNNKVLSGERRTLHGCLITKISTIQFFIEYPVKRTKISRDILSVSRKRSSWNSKSGNKTGLCLNLVLFILTTNCWYIICQQLENRTNKIICMFLQNRIWNLCSENLRKLLAKCLSITQENEWSKNWAVIVATKGTFLDFCVQSFTSEYRNLRYFDTIGF
jgi:hypothetical protein